MLSVYHLKPKFQKLLLPVLDQLHRHRVTANGITVMAVIWSCLLGALIFFSSGHPILLIFAAAGLLIRMALNALDGMMARTYNQQSKLGEILNELGDVVSDTVIFAGLFAFPFVNPFLLFTVIILSVINEFAGVLAKIISGTRRYDGPMGKSDRALLIGLWCIVYFIFPHTVNFFNTLFAGAVILLIISTYKRVSNALKN